MCPLHIFLLIIVCYFGGIVPQLFNSGAEERFPLLIANEHFFGRVVAFGNFGDEVAEVKDACDPLVEAGEGQIVVGVDDGLGGELRHYL